MPLLKPNKAKPDPSKVRVEKVVVAPPKPAPRPATLNVSKAAAPSPHSARLSPRPSSSSQSLRTKSASPYPSSSDDRRAERKRKAAAAEKKPRPSPASERVTFDNDSDDEEDDNDWLNAIDGRKRQRRDLGDGRLVDENRTLRQAKSFATPVRELRLIHAADVASLRDKCEPVLGAKKDEVAVQLQYPSLHTRERYELVWGKDKIDAVKEIIKVVRFVADTYLTDKEAVPFLDPITGFARQLEKASNRNIQDLAGFKAALAGYNDKLLSLVRDGTIIRNLDSRHELPRSFVAFILEQVYDRTVAPKVELLSKYENGTDNVYGELLPPFVSDVLVERTRMTSEQVFVDLGSGVGNVALQAALEIGCESWGCEMMENACNLAEAQQREFSARCRLWGIAPGKVHLERGDFRKNDRIIAALKRADVILVNNQAFTAQLNDDLVRMFLDLKPGCRIVSLKSFVKNASHNINDVGSTILDVEDLTYPQGYVSWTGAGGAFCISTKK